MALRRLSAIAAISMLLSAANLFAAETRRSVDGLVRHHELAPVSAAELFPGVSGGAIEVHGSIETALARPMTIVRELPVAWELRVPLGTDVGELDVELELSGGDGAFAAVSRAGAAEEIPVSLTAGRPRIVRREARSLVVAGSARFKMRVADVEQAGRYEGTLTVRLTPR